MMLLVRSEDFESEVSREQRPVLLACFYGEAELRTQLRVVESVSEGYKDTLKTCVIDEDFLSTLRGALEIVGTPTFLIFHEGEEKSRILGHVDRETLSAFVQQTLRQLRRVLESNQSAALLSEKMTWRNDAA
jgi:thioredoxin 1